MTSIKKNFLTLFLGGMVVAIGLYFAPAAQAEEPLPEHDQLSTEITTQVNAEVQSELNGSSTSQATSSTENNPIPTTPDTLFINTGDNASVDNSASQNSNTAVNNQNLATVGQGVNATANTGGNSASKNISFGGNAGVINTGNAVVYNDLIANANNNQSGIGNSCSLPATDSNVVNTGDNLDFDASSTSNCLTTVSNNNGATINQAINASANTGNNVAEGNIAFGGGAAGQITTGDAAVGSLVVANANRNMVIVGGISNNGAPGSGASIYIVNTGDDAMVNSSQQQNTSTAITNSNVANVAQVINATANTGDNDSSRNINLNGDAGVIHTGDAVVKTSASVEANNNSTTVANNGQGTSGSTATDVVNTGDNLDVDSSSESNTSTTVTNTNVAEVDQEVTVYANTGNNTADRNIAFNGDAGVISTGDAIIVTELETEVNSNKTLITETAPNSDSDSTTEIVNTGDNLDVDVSHQTNSTTTVNNTNVAAVNQTVNATGNTGGNTASGNIGQSSMTTGNVTITTEIITNANNNYTFIVDSNVNGLELFKQFVAAFWGMDWDDLMTSVNNQGPANNAVAIVNTGDNATILADHVQNRDVVVNNTNTANVNQQVNVNANTGGNTCDANVGDCRITTGDATIWTQLIANLNNNFTFVGNVQLPNPQPEPEPQPEPQPEPTPQPEVDGEVLGENVERQPRAVLAATTLPMTGGEANLALLGLALIGGGLALRFKKATA